MKKKIHLLIVVPILAWSVDVQAQISLTGQYIPRAEIKGGDKDANSYWTYLMLKLTPVFLNKEIKNKNND